MSRAVVVQGAELPSWLPLLGFCIASILALPLLGLLSLAVPGLEEARITGGGPPWVRLDPQRLWIPGLGLVLLAGAGWQAFVRRRGVAILERDLLVLRKGPRFQAILSSRRIDGYGAGSSEFVQVDAPRARGRSAGVLDLSSSATTPIRYA